MFGFTLYELFWYFVIYAVLGWCLEVCFCTIDTGQLVNRGFLNGPVCPIYGFGMVIVLLCLTPLRHNIFILYVGGAVLTSLLELVGGFVLKKLFHTTWWDYSDQPFNVGGYICLKFSLAWGVAVVGVMMFIHPAVAALVDFVPHMLGVALGVLAALLFLCDLAVTVVAVTKMNRDLGHIAEIARLLHEGSETLAENLGSGALAVDEKLDETKLDAAARLDIARAELMDHKYAIHMRLMKAFPQMTNLHYNDALEQLKSWYKEHDKK